MSFEEKFDWYEYYTFADSLSTLNPAKKLFDEFKKL